MVTEFFSLYMKYEESRENKKRFGLHYSENVIDLWLVHVGSFLLYCFLPLLVLVRSSDTKGGGGG